MLKILCKKNCKWSELRVLWEYKGSSHLGNPEGDSREIKWYWN